MFSIKTAFFTVILAAFSAAAFAESYHVTIWNGLADCSGGKACMFNADKANIPVPIATALADFYFTPDNPPLGINWATTSNFNTYGAFLNGGQITGFSGTLSQSSFLSSLMSEEGNGFASYFAITGSYTSPSDFTRSIMHDDGASLYVDGASIFSAPGLVTGQATAASYHFSGGTHDFSLYYVAADGGPAVLNFGMPNAFAPAAVPEPATLALLGLGLVGLGFARRRPRASTRR